MNRAEFLRTVAGLAFSLPFYSLSGCSGGAGFLSAGLPQPGKRVWEHDLDGPFAAAFSPDAKLLCIGHSQLKRNPTASLWSVDGPTHLADLPGHRGDVKAVAFSPDGRMLATSGTDLAIRIWDVTSRDLRHVIQFDREEAMALAFNADGTRLAAAAGTGLYVWDTKLWKQLARGDVEGPARALTFSANKSRWIVGDDVGRLSIWDTASVARVDRADANEDWKGAIGTLSSSSDGRTILSTDVQTATVNVWSFDGESLKPSLHFRDPHGGKAWTHAGLMPDGRSFAVVAANEKSRLMVVDVKTGKPRYEAGKGFVRVVVAPKDDLFLALTSRRISELWKLTQ